MINFVYIVAGLISGVTSLVILDIVYYPSSRWRTPRTQKLLNQKSFIPAHPSSVPFAPILPLHPFCSHQAADIAQSVKDLYGWFHIPDTFRKRVSAQSEPLFHRFLLLRIVLDLLHGHQYLHTSIEKGLIKRNRYSWTSKIQATELALRAASPDMDYDQDNPESRQYSTNFSKRASL